MVSAYSSTENRENYSLWIERNLHISCQEIFIKLSTHFCSNVFFPGMLTTYLQLGKRYWLYWWSSLPLGLVQLPYTLILSLILPTNDQLCWAALSKSVDRCRKVVIRRSSREHWKIISKPMRNEIILFLAMPAWFLLIQAKGKELFGIFMGFSSFMLKSYQATALL